MRKSQPIVRSVDLTHSSLTVRESEVMHLAAKGLTNRAIARELNVSEGTIKLHLHHAVSR